MYIYIHVFTHLFLPRTDGDFKYSKEESSSIFRGGGNTGSSGGVNGGMGMRGELNTLSLQHHANDRTQGRHRGSDASHLNNLGSALSNNNSMGIKDNMNISVSLNSGSNFNDNALHSTLSDEVDLNLHLSYPYAMNGMMGVEGSIDGMNSLNDGGKQGKHCMHRYGMRVGVCVFVVGVICRCIHAETQ